MDVHDLVADDRWAASEPLHPPHPPHPQVGNAFTPDRPECAGSALSPRRGSAGIGCRCRAARKGVESKARLGRHRRVVERTSALRHRYRRLPMRHARLGPPQQAYRDRGRALTCFLHRRGQG